MGIQRSQMEHQRGFASRPDSPCVFQASILGTFCKFNRNDAAYLVGVHPILNPEACMLTSPYEIHWNKVQTDYGKNERPSQNQSRAKMLSPINQNANSYSRQDEYPTSKPRIWRQIPSIKRESKTS